MTLTQTLFGFKGRLGRLAYLGFSALVLFVLLISTMVGALLMHSGSAAMAMPAFLMVGATALCCWAALALTVKRLHDMDMSGWNTVWIYAVMVVGSMFSGAPNVGPVLSAVITLPLWAWLTFKTGTEGSNRFGPPREPAQTAATGHSQVCPTPSPAPDQSAT
ncbi:DUF805 domain-containing protein [Roseomonas sp. GCM10028921]